MLFIFSLFCIYFSCCRALFLCLLHFLSLLFFSRRETGDNFTSLYSSNINIGHSLVVSSLGSLTSYVFFTHFHPSRNTRSNEETWKGCISSCPLYSSWATCISIIPAPKSESEINFNAEKNGRNSHSTQEVKWQWFLRHWRAHSVYRQCLYYKGQMASGSQKWPGWRRGDDPAHHDWPWKTGASLTLERHLGAKDGWHKGSLINSFTRKGHATFMFSIKEMQLLK